jgi:hypothetical protein
MEHLRQLAVAEQRDLARLDRVLLRGRLGLGLLVDDVVELDRVGCWCASRFWHPADGRQRADR